VPICRLIQITADRQHRPIGIWYRSQLHNGSH
jgi:hypothetical protein